MRNNSATYNFNQPSPGQQIQCPHCPMILHSTRDLTAHISAAHSEALPYTCDLCGKGYMTSQGLNHHHKSAHLGKQFTCPVCKSMFTHKYLMKRHLKNVHGAAQCDSCSMMFEIGEEFNSHLMQCHA